VQRIPALAANTAWRTEGLADQNRTGPPHARDDGGVAIWDVAPEHPEPGGGGKAGGVEDVLGGEGHTMQRSQDVFPGVLAIRLARLLQRAFGGREDHGVDPRIHRVNVLEVSPHHFQR
jgi:hypothetical protein